MSPLTKGLNYRSACDVTVPVTVQNHGLSHALSYLANNCVFSLAVISQHQWCYLCGRQEPLTKQGVWSVIGNHMEQFEIQTLTTFKTFCYWQLQSIIPEISPFQDGGRLKVTWRRTRTNIIKMYPAKIYILSKVSKFPISMFNCMHTGTGAYCMHPSYLSSRLWFLSS